MKQSQRTVSVVILATLLALSVVPQGAMASTPTNVVSYGIEYDWSNLDGDIEGFTDLDFNDILRDVMDAATSAGFDLIVAEITTGASNMYVLSEEDHTAQTVNGYSGDVWSRTTDLTIRHGMLADSALYTQWNETTFGSPDTTGFDIEASYDIDNTFTVDALYVEYFDDTTGELVGADLDFAVNAGMGAEFTVLAEIEGGGELLDIDFGISASADIGLDSSHTEWRLNEGSELYSIVSTQSNTDWECVETGSTELWADVNDECGEMDGTYSASMNYAFDLSGIPTEEFGMAAGEFDFSLSDTLSNSGVFEITESDLAYSGMYFDMSDSISVDLGDGSSTTVRFCNSCGPANPLMFWMMGHVLEASMSETLETFGEDIADEMDMELGELNPWGLAESNSGDPYDPYEGMYLCDNGNYVYDWVVNDGWDDCGDNSDEDVLLGYPWFNYDSGADDLGYGINFDNLIASPNFICGDGSTINFDWVNDDYADCPDGADEQWLDMNTPANTADDCQVWDTGASCVGSEVNWFDCQDGSEPWIHQVNDGTSDCYDGDDEGIVYSVEIIVTDYNGNIVTSLLEDVTASDNSAYTSLMPAGLSSTSGICLDITLEDVYGNTESTYNYCEHIGMYVYRIDAYDGEGLSVETGIHIEDTYGSTGYTAEISVMEVGSTTATDSVTHAIDGNDWSAYFDDNLAVTAEGDYVVVVDIYDTGALYSSETSDEFSVEDEPQPSQKLMDIGDAFANSNIESVLESFGQNMEQVFEDLEPSETFPYDDGKGVFLWSNEHATIVGLGVYVHDETANEWQTMFGPTTAAMDNPPTIPVSINYVTGQGAVDASTTASGQTTLAEIVDVSTHDTADLEQELIDAGIDPADLGLGNEGPGQSTTPPTAEELVDEGGLLPFISPAAAMTVTILAGLIAAVRNREEE
ncbi:MAG: hypothetical protein NZ736_06110 [Candidatus Poseidoniaceae archaeon]|nr:hypothetical protein [Candidatus Poseidoniaceae archaeon]